MPFVVMVVSSTERDAHRIADRFTGSSLGRAVGIFEYPTTHRQPTCRGFCMDGKLSPWTRHRKGYIICAVCGHRHRKTKSRIIGALFDLMGANLINDRAPAAFRTPEGYGGNSDSPN